MKRESKLDSPKRLRDPSQNEHGGPRRNTGVSPQARGLQPQDVPLGTGTRGRDAGNAEGLYVACVAVFTERVHTALLKRGVRGRPYGTYPRSSPQGTARCMRVRPYGTHQHSSCR